MRVLDDAALWARGLHPALRDEGRIKPPSNCKVRFLPTSTFARDFDLPLACVGEIRDRWVQDGREVLGVLVDGVGYLSGVPVAEVEAVFSASVLP